MSKDKTEVKKHISIILKTMKVFLFGMTAGILLIEYLRNKRRPVAVLYSDDDSSEIYDKEEI